MGVAGFPVILIIAAIAIPNLLRARIAANESSAVASLRTIATAESSYSSSHPDLGYTCSLAALGEAGLIDDNLALGQRTGYRFEITGCDSEGLGGANKYKAVAYPLTVNQTGKRAFCMDESAVIRQDSGGLPRRCLKNGVALR